MSGPQGFQERSNFWRPDNPIFFCRPHVPLVGVPVVDDAAAPCTLSSGVVAVSG